jgi:hypothetical protein
MTVLVILGITLVIFGGIVLLLLPNRPGGELSFRGVSVKSPTAGLPLIVLGLVAVSLGYGLEDDKSKPTENTASTTTTQRAQEISTNAVTVPSTAAPTTVPPSGCVIRVDHIGARISEKPRHDARELGSVPAGEYRTLDFTVSNWAGRDEGWFLIKVTDRQGWIVDNGLLITEKSSGCP